MTIYYISFIASAVSNILALAVGSLYCYRRTNEKFLRIFPLYLLMSFSVDIFSGSFRNARFALNNLFTAAELLTFAWFFLQILKSRVIKWQLGVSLLGFAGFFITYSMNNGLGKAPNVIAIVLEIFIIIVPCLTWYHELFTRQETINLFSDSSYWLVTGILFYLSSTLPFYVASIYFTIHGLFLAAQSLLSINNFANIIMYLLFIKGFTCKARGESLPRQAKK